MIATPLGKLRFVRHSSKALVILVYDHKFIESNLLL